MVNRLIKSVFAGLGFCVSGLFIGVILAHVFIWTLYSGAPEFRQRLSLLVAGAASGGCACACLLLREYRSSGFSSDRSIKERILAAAPVWFVLGLTSSIVVWGWYGTYGLAEFAQSWVITGPLAAGVFAGCGWLLNLASDGRYGMAVSTLVGSSVGFLLLEPMGSYWIIVLMALAPGIGWLLTKYDVVRHGDGVVKAVMIIGFGAILYHVFFGTLLFAWAAGTAMSLFVAVWVALHLLNVALGEESEAVDVEVPVAVHGWIRKGLSSDYWRNVVRKIRPRDGVVFGWCAVVFVHCNWTEPSFMREPRPFFEARIPEPKLPRQIDGLGVSMSELSSWYQDQWSIYNIRMYEKWAAKQTHSNLTALAQQWNALIEWTVYTRWGIKILAWVAIFRLTAMFGCRYAKGLTQEEIVSTKRQLKEMTVALGCVVIFMLAVGRMGILEGLLFPFVILLITWDYNRGFDRRFKAFRQARRERLAVARSGGSVVGPDGSAIPKASTVQSWCAKIGEGEQLPERMGPR